jgi:hypothetical protein
MTGVSVSHDHLNDVHEIGQEFIRSPATSLAELICPVYFGAAGQFEAGQEKHARRSCGRQAADAGRVLAVPRESLGANLTPVAYAGTLHGAPKSA